MLQWLMCFLFGHDYRAVAALRYLDNSYCSPGDSSVPSTKLSLACARCSAHKTQTFWGGGHFTVDEYNRRIKAQITGEQEDTP